MKIQNGFVTGDGVLHKVGFRGLPGLIKMLKEVNASCKKLGYETTICVKFPIRRTRKKYEGEMKVDMQT